MTVFVKQSLNPGFAWSAKDSTDTSTLSTVFFATLAHLMYYCVKQEKLEHITSHGLVPGRYVQQSFLASSVFVLMAQTGNNRNMLIVMVSGMSRRATWLPIFCTTGRNKKKWYQITSHGIWYI